MKRGIAAFTSIFGIGYLGYMLMPSVLSSASVRYDLDETQIGLSATTQLFALALSLFATAPLLQRLGGKIIAVVGGLLAINGYLLAAMATSFEFYLLGLLLAGLGAGAAISGGDSFVASAKNPSRLYGFIFALGQLSAILMLIAVLPELDSSVKGGGYLLLAAWSGLMTVLLLFSPAFAPESHSNANSIPSVMIFSAPVVAMFLLGIADAAVWPFSAEIGKTLGLSDGNSELVLAAALFAGVIGAGGASVAADTSSNSLVVLTLVLLSLAYAGVLMATTIPIYATSQISVLLFFGFAIPFILGSAGQIDPSGKLMATASGAQMFGFGISPWIAGILMAELGKIFLAGIVAICAVSCVPLYLKASRKTKKAL